MNESVWHKDTDDLDWGSHGIVELHFADGRIVTCRIYVDMWFDGEDEIPLFTVGGYHGDPDVSLFYDAEKWRLVEGKL